MQGRVGGAEGEVVVRQRPEQVDVWVQMELEGQSFAPRMQGIGKGRVEVVETVA
jgi:hypothetical protein